MKQLGYGKDYAYDHDAPDRFSGQDYFPDGMARAALLRADRARGSRPSCASGWRGLDELRRAAIGAGRGRERAWSTGCSTAPLGAHRPPDVLDQLCRRLRAEGLPLDRAGLFVEVLHPQFLGFSSRWLPDRPIEVRPAPRELADRARVSSTVPRTLVARTGRSLRCDLTAPGGRRRACGPGAAARRRLCRLSDPAGPLQPWRGPRRELGDPAAGRLRRARSRDA